MEGKNPKGYSVHDSTPSVIKTSKYFLEALLRHDREFLGKSVYGRTAQGV